MATIKIQNKPLKPALNGNHTERFSDFVTAIVKMKVGQSFTLDYFPAHFRQTLSAFRIGYGLVITSKKEGDGYRIGRIA